MKRLLFPIFAIVNIVGIFIFFYAAIIIQKTLLMTDTAATIMQ